MKTMEDNPVKIADCTLCKALAYSATSPSMTPSMAGMFASQLIDHVHAAHPDEVKPRQIQRLAK